MANRRWKYVFRDVSGDLYTVTGVKDVELAREQARDKGARGHLDLIKAEGKNLMELFKHPRK